MKKLFVLLLTCSNIVFAGCSKNNGPDDDDDNGGGSTPGKESGIAKGRVTDSRGNPISGATIIVDNTVYFNSGLTGTTDANGYYRIAVPQGSWRVYARIDKQFNGKLFQKLDLHPDNPDSFAGTEGTVCNFEWRVKGEKPIPLAGHYGGMVYLGIDPNANLYDMENVEFTFTPVGTLIDGSTGQAFTARSGAPRTDNFSKIPDVPIGRYTVTARHVPTNRKLKLLVEEASDEFAESVTMDFFPELNYCTRCVRLIYTDN
ncbi:MAG TPA: carboxypeptidase-like regulatory domain-containing protein [Chitinophagaceae bacterium]|nr:carboxypeptidase-like regulatory domain-containing protein [Chitinophagaceae bacterium]